jgi:hypothetical protein
MDPSRDLLSNSSNDAVLTARNVNLPTTLELLYMNDRISAVDEAGVLALLDWASWLQRGEPDADASELLSVTYAITDLAEGVTTLAAIQASPVGHILVQAADNYRVADFTDAWRATILREAVGLPPPPPYKPPCQTDTGLDPSSAQPQS